MELLRLGVLGGLLALDGTAVGQFMFSRPLVAGLLAGWMLGAPEAGVAVGAVLELYLLVSIPAGGARFPESSVATVVAVAVAVPFDGSGAIPLGLAWALLWGQFAGLSVSAQRHLNVHLVPEPGTPSEGRSLTVAHLGAIATDFLRGTVVTAVGIWLGRLGLEPFVEAWPLDDAMSRGVVLTGGIVSAGIVLRDLGGVRRRGVWFVAGILLAVVGAAIL